MWSSAEPGLRSGDLMSVGASQVDHGPTVTPARRKGLRLLSMCIALMSLTSIASAQDIGFEAAVYDTPLFRRLESKGQIFFDRRDPPLLLGAVLERRQDSGGSSPSTSTDTASLAFSDTSTATSSSTTAVSMSSVSNPTSSVSHSLTSGVSQSPSATTTTTSATSATQPSVTIVTTAIPSPFDSSLGSNFTSQACPDFFNTFLSNSTFKSCVPVSLLLQNSKSFFTAARSPVLLAETLDIACAASLPICQPLMASLASDLISDSHCGADYRNQNPLVSQAHAGLVAYEPVYQATCHKSNDTGNFCFADAITNQLNPSDSYPYYAAVGLNLPTASRPTCSKCLQNTMSIFAGYAKDKNQPLATTYLNTAQEINVDCGARFADTTVPVGTVSSSNGGAGQRRNINSLPATVTAVAIAIVLVIGLV